MPNLKTVKDVLAFKDSFKGTHTRIVNYRAIVDGKADDVLASVKAIAAPEFQKAFVPYQTALVGKVAQRMTNIMASNQSEIRYKARSTDSGKINLVQRHEHGHEALDPLLFPLPTRRRMYAFLTDSYTVVALDVRPRPGAISKYADRDKLQKYAEETESVEDDDDAPEASYHRAYHRSTKTSAAEKHEQAYDSVTKEALIEDGPNVTARVVDPLTFKGFQSDEDPCRFAIGMEYGKKQLNPLLKALEGYGVRSDNGCLYIADGDKRTYSKSYEALGVGTISDSQSTSSDSDEYVEYTQIRTCEETVILLENVNQAKGEGEGGIIIHVPNLYGEASTGYYLIEGDPKLRSGDIEERYDPPLRNLMNEAQHYNITRTAWEAMSLAELTRGLYQYDEGGGSQPIEPHSSTEETKSAQPEDGQPIPQASGKVLRVEGFGQKTEVLLEHARDALREAEPTDIWGGTGSSSETGIAIARRASALLTELTPYQANIATVCKYIHMDVDAYVAASGEAIYLSYLPEGAKERKPEIREITPRTAKLAMDLDYTLGSDTPESKYAAEQMSAQRYEMGLIGKMDHMEEIGIKDPQATEQRQIEDAIVLASTPMLVDTASKLAAEYTKAALEREFGRMPAPPPDPMAMQQPMGMAPPAPLPTPQGVMPPTQTVPDSGGVPVVPGGPPGVG